VTTAEMPPRPLPRSRSHPLRPPAGLAELASEGPARVMFPNGTVAWLVARYDDVRAVLGDPRFSSYRHGDEPAMRNDPIISMDVPANFNIKDGAEHQRYRRPLSRAFMVKRINQLRPRIEQIVADRLDEMERQGPPADLVSALCLPVPSMVIAELLGVPGEHQELFQRFARAMFGLTTSMEEFQAVGAELGAVLLALLEDRRRTGDTSDFLGLLVNDEDPLPDEELMFIGRGMLAAGHETTTNQAGLAVLSLFEHPDQLKLFIEHPENAPAMVDELLRYVLPIGSGGGLPRRATEDVEVGGQLIRKGEWVAASSYGNYDESVCPHGSELRLDRSDPPAHLSFGYGPHQCLGQNLARAELEIMLTGLFGRFPTLRLDGEIRDLPYRTDMLVYGVYELPVTW
jgi:cytochrome P450